MNALKKLCVLIGWAFFSLFVLFLLMFVAGIAALSRGGIAEQDLSAMLVSSDHAVGMVEIEGEIMSSKDFRKNLKDLVDNDKIKAIVVRIDSPGGAVGASEEMYAAIKKASEKKPVVCSMSSVAASGGLYAAMGCGKVLANPGTLTGSIGVIMMTPNVSPVLDKFGLSMTVVKSGQFKDTGSPFRPVTAEDKKLLQDLVDAAYQEFVKVVADARKLDVEKVKSFADGRILTGMQAQALGVVDELGDSTRAAKVALELAGDTAEPEVILPKKPSPFFEYLNASGISRFVHYFNEVEGSRLLYKAFL